MVKLLDFLNTSEVERASQGIYLLKSLTFGFVNSEPRLLDHLFN